MDTALLAFAASTDTTHALPADGVTGSVDPIEAWARRALFASGFGGGLADLGDLEPNLPRAASDRTQAA